MLDIVKKFPEQVEEALKMKIDFSAGEIESIAIAGMGGSAISGDILQHFSTLPFFVIRDYTPPPFLNHKTLFIAISYSGNTEETISCYEKVKNKCKTFALTSGGKLAEMEENKLIIPSGMQPRAAIAYLLFPLARYLSENGFLNGIDLDETLYVLKSNTTQLQETAKKVANSIEGIPIIYGYGVMGSIAKRWRQQFNENAKIPSFDFSLPECNHNELEAWESNENKFTCIFLRSKGESERINARFEYMKEIYGEKAKVIEVFSVGSNIFSQAISLLHIGDLASVYMAQSRNIDAEPVKLITGLKKYLSQHSRSSS